MRWDVRPRGNVRQCGQDVWRPGLYQPPFAFALPLAIDFNCYLIDEVVAAGDQRFQRRSHEELFEKRADRTLILASHMGEVIKSYCSRALVMHHGLG
jgi:capsular polysaccharide transport system ATP-binding protein